MACLTCYCTEVPASFFQQPEEVLGPSGGVDEDIGDSDHETDGGHTQQAQVGSPQTQDETNSDDDEPRGAGDEATNDNPETNSGGATMSRPEWHFPPWSKMPTFGSALHAGGGGGGGGQVNKYAAFIGRVAIVVLFASCIQLEHNCAHCTVLRTGTF